MSANDYYYEQVATMIRKGRTAQYIANRLSKSLQWVEEAAAHPDVIERSTEMRAAQLAKSDPKMWKKERISLEIQGSTPEILDVARAIALNTEAADTNRLKAVEIWLRHNEEMPLAKDAAGEQGGGIHIDEAIGQRLIDLALSRAKRQRLSEGSIDTTGGVVGDC